MLTVCARSAHSSPHTETFYISIIIKFQSHIIIFRLYIGKIVDQRTKTITAKPKKCHFHINKLIFVQNLLTLNFQQCHRSFTCQQRPQRHNTPPLGPIFKRLLDINNILIQRYAVDNRTPCASAQQCTAIANAHMLYSYVYMEDTNHCCTVYVL